MQIDPESPVWKAVETHARKTIEDCRTLRERKAAFADAILADFDIHLTAKCQDWTMIEVSSDTARLWLRDRLVDFIRDECVA